MLVFFTLATNLDIKWTDQSYILLVGWLTFLLSFSVKSILEPAYNLHISYI